jgi:capsid protein
MGRLRDAWHALRGYAAAQDSRASSWAASGSSATAEVGLAAPTVARRARDAVRNDPYAARIVDLWTGNAVGAGITTRWPDKPHADARRRWSDSTACDAEGRLELYGLQALVMRAAVESGECFVRLLPADITPANPIGLRLQVLQSDHLDAAREGVIDGVPTLQGIGLGDAGEPVGYWLHRVHPAVGRPGSREECATLARRRVRRFHLAHVVRCVRGASAAARARAAMSMPQLLIPPRDGPARWRPPPIWTLAVGIGLRPQSHTGERTVTSSFTLRGRGFVWICATSSVAGC